MTSDSVPLDSIFTCARQIVFLNRDSSYPVSFGGTAFVVSYQGMFFVVTAAHVMGSFKRDQFGVHYSRDNSSFIPLLRPYNIFGDDDNDTDQYDVLILTVDKSRLDVSLFGDCRPYDLRDTDALISFEKSDSFAFRGFPTRFRNVDYESQKFEMVSVTCDGSYLGRSESQELHKLRVNRVSEIGDFDGLSGSPVFQIHHVDKRQSRQSFAGMLLRGTVEAGTVEFLESRKIIEVLQRIVECDVVPFRDA